MLEHRRLVIQGLFILIGIIFLAKLFALQVTDSTYQLKAERNIIQTIIEYPFRGLIYDRNKELIVHNEPIYDIMVVPRDFYVEDTAAFCKLFNIDKAAFIKNLSDARQYSAVKPSPFLNKISHREYASIQDHLYQFKGLYANPRTVRRYTQPMLAHQLGYIGEVSQRQLDRDSSGYYQSGDFIGITGLEEQYEKELRGVRGKSYKMVNVNGIAKGSFRDGELDTASVAGKNLITTIDMELQAYAEKLLKGKRGSVVAIEPASGEVLVMASSPSYNPNELSGKNFGNNFEQIEKDTLAPLFNRAIMATYPPGSIFKTVQALVALDQGVIDPSEKVRITKYNLGDHAALGTYDIPKGLEYSSNNFFYEVMRRVINQNESPNYFKDSRLGMEKWAEAVRKFGFGQKLGLDVPGEVPGMVPDVETYDKMHGELRWAYSTIYSLSIGQGEMLVTPLQVANLAATIANQGYYITPHLVKGIETKGSYEALEFEKHETGEGTDYYPAIIEGMSRAVKKTANVAVIPDIEMVGKTGTAENGVKDETFDHSVFMAYAPRENPQIAVAVYVENAGWGGLAAGITASLIIEKHIRGYIDKKGYFDKENYVLEQRYLEAIKN